jgi:hypothetical protein
MIPSVKVDLSFVRQHSPRCHTTLKQHGCMVDPDSEQKIPVNLTTLVSKMVPILVHTACALLHAGTTVTSNFMIGEARLRRPSEAQCRGVATGMPKRGTHKTYKITMWDFIGSAQNPKESTTITLNGFRMSYNDYNILGT